MIGELDGTEATFGRRRFVQGAIGAATAGGAMGSLASPRAAAAHRRRDHAPLPAPTPIPGGLQIPDGPLLHAFLPGPENVPLPFTGLNLQGLNVDPSTITDFQGFTALAYVVGTATDHEGRAHNLVTDIRAYKGQYIAADGTRRVGRFAFISVDLFEPGSGAHVHNFNGGIAPSGLFWTVELDDDALAIRRGGLDATLAVEDAPVIDSFALLGSNQIPASVSFEIRWEAMGPPMRLGSGATVAPSDPAAFLGRFATARATGSFSGRELGFGFESDPGASSDRVYAQLGGERNGAFLR